MTAVRCSSLPIVRYCGAAGPLGQSHGAGRAAAMGTAWHAICDDPGLEKAETRAALASLTNDERAEVLARPRPTDVDLGEGVVLRWAEATRERPVFADRDLRPCRPEAAAITGHPDAYWICDGVVYVADLKSSMRHVEDGPASLQLQAYGLILAHEAEAHGYTCGIFAADTASWTWMDRVVEVDSWDAAEVVAAIQAAIDMPQDEYRPGPWCSSCWSRWHCPQHVVPNIEGTLAALVDGDGPATPEEALKALRVYERAVDTLKVVKAALEAYAEAHDGIRDPEAGKVWRKVVASKGGTRIDTKRLRADHPDLVAQYTVPTPPRSLGFRWCKE